MRVLLTIAVLVGIVVVFYFISDNITRYTGLLISEDVLDREIRSLNCLEDRDVVLYINSADSAASLRESSLSDYLSYIKIFNCLENKDYCLMKNISPPQLSVDEILYDEFDGGFLEVVGGC